MYSLALAFSPGLHAEEVVRLSYVQPRATSYSSDLRWRGGTPIRTVTLGLISWLTYQMGSTPTRNTRKCHTWHRLGCGITVTP
jgi:hypothetical protein